MKLDYCSNRASTYIPFISFIYFKDFFMQICLHMYSYAYGLIIVNIKLNEQILIISCWTNHFM